MVRIIFSAFVGMLVLLSGCAKNDEDTEQVYNTTVILGTWYWNVETDTQGSSDVTDFKWDQITETERYLAPKNGAEAKVIPNGDFDAIDSTFIEKQILSTDRISGPDEDHGLVPGTVVVFKTVEGNLGKLQVEEYRALHDFSFKEAEYLSEDWRSFALKKPNKDMYHLQVKWQLYQ